MVILFAGAKGFLEKYEVSRLKDYEAQLLAFIQSKYSNILKEIDDKQIISPELETKMKDIMAEFDTVFVAG